MCASHALMFQILFFFFMTLFRDLDLHLKIQILENIGLLENVTKLITY